MRLSKSATALTLVAIIASTAVIAKDVPVVLTGLEETPPVTTAAKGTGTITIADDHSVSGNLKTSGIEGTIAHIHVGAPGVSGPPIITLEKDGTGWRVPQGAKLTDDQFADYKAGNLYVNVYSQDHKPGEIRAQLKP